MSTDNEPTRQEIGEIVMTGISYGDSQTGVTRDDPTYDQIVEELIGPALAHISGGLVHTGFALRAGDIETAHHTVDGIMHFIEEVIHPALETVHEAVVDYTVRKQELGPIEIPDALPVNFGTE